MARRPPIRPAPCRPLLLAAALCLAGPALAQDYANADLPDWQEDQVPPPPAYTTEAARLIDIDMPASASVKVGIDPATIAINRATGIVRYVVVLRGPSAVNASYEGIRCATGEYKVYARQSQGGPWSPSSPSQWKPMLGQSGIVVTYPTRLAQRGLCFGPSVRQNVAEAVRDLRSGEALSP